jgi:two-component system, cell cycle sensor histidine kinase and response regulator CckA
MNHRNHRVIVGSAPTLIVAVAAAAAAQWSYWLHPGNAAELAVAPAAGVALAALLLLPRRHWPGPLVATALAVAIVDLLHDVDTAVSIGRAVAAVAGALLAAVLLRRYSDGTFRLARVNDLLALVAAAAVGGALAGIVSALALLIGGSAPDLWRPAHLEALADAFGMVVVSAAALTATAARGRRTRGGRVEACVLAVAVLASSVLMVARWDDPLAYTSVLVLGWAALRYGPAGVAIAGFVMVGAAEWAAARQTGPFTATAGGAGERVLVLQMFVAVALLSMLALALALDERDSADERRWIATERFRRAFNDAPIGMVVATLDGHIVETNRAVRELLGYDDDALVGTQFRSLRADDSGEHEIPRAWPTGPEPAQLPELRLVDAHGEIVWVEITEARLRHFAGAPEFKIVAIQDVTERKGLRQQLVHAQKMESVGRLAGGIAHDFNNVLAIMRGQVELLQDDLAVLERARARMDSVQRATDRAAALTDDLMAFSRRRVDEPEPLDLNELVLSLRELLHQLLGATVSLELRLDAAPATILADPNRIEQAVLNLAVNARDAMPSGGRLTIATRSGPLPTRPVILCVADTGIGMDEATRARVFEAFFTTKPPGLGTGLGLSTTDDIVRSTGGTIEVQSELGHGSTFVLTFPAVTLDGQLSDPSGEIDLSVLSGDDRPTVLVVDDEPEVRKLVTEILRSSGYRVVAAADGATALAVVERAPHAVDLLVTDVVMPVMSGTDLAERVTERSPSTRVLFVSGFVPAGSAALRGAPLLTKPLRRAQLLEAVHAALQQ